MALDIVDCMGLLLPTLVIGLIFAFNNDLIA